MNVEALINEYYYVKWDIFCSQLSHPLQALWSAELSAPRSPAAGQVAGCQVDPQRVIQPGLGRTAIVLASSKDAAAKPSDSSGLLEAKVFFTFPHCSVSSAFSKWNNKNTEMSERWILQTDFGTRPHEMWWGKHDLSGQVKFCLLGPGCCK